MANSSGGVAPESYITGKRISDADEFFDNTVDFNDISYILATITQNGQTSTYTLRKSLSSYSFACFGAPTDNRWLTKFRFDSYNPVSIVYDNGRYSLYVPDPNEVGTAADFDIKAGAVENNSYSSREFDDLVNSVTRDCVEKVNVLGRFSWYNIPATTAGYVSVRATGVAKLPNTNNGEPLIVSDYDPSNGPVIVVCTEDPLTYNLNYFYCPVKDVLYIYEDCVDNAYTTPYISRVMLAGSLGNRDIMADLIYTFINDTSETSEGDTIDLVDVPICAIVKTKNLVKVKYSDIVEQGGSSV